MLPQPSPGEGAGEARPYRIDFSPEFRDLNERFCNFALNYGAFLGLDGAWERRILPLLGENESLLREEPAPGFGFVPEWGSGDRRGQQGNKPGKGSMQGFPRPWDETGTSPTPEHLLSPEKQEEITGISDTPWNVPAWLLGKEKGEKAPGTFTHPLPCCGFVPLPRAPARGCSKLGHPVPAGPIPRWEKQSHSPRMGSRGGL